MPPPDSFERFDEDIRRMSRDQLARAFGAASSGRLVLKRLMRALIMQAWRAIREGSEEPVQGNLRTFWYRWVKPVEAKLAREWLPRSGTYGVDERGLRRARDGAGLGLLRRLRFHR